MLKFCFWAAWTGFCFLRGPSRSRLGAYALAYGFVYWLFYFDFSSKAMVIFGYAYFTGYWGSSTFVYLLDSLCLSLSRKLNFGFYYYSAGAILVSMAFSGSGFG
jgi:hypothetical protein